MSGTPAEIRPIRQEELPQALALVERVFMRFEAPEYEPRGVDAFFAFLRDPEAIRALALYGAFIEGSVAGVIATRGGSHIALFFVEAERQGQGIGRALFDAARETCRADAMTVNASPYAVEIYRRLGFAPLSGEQVTDGIRFTPMKCALQKEALCDR